MALDDVGFKVRATEAAESAKEAANRGHVQFTIFSKRLVSAFQSCFNVSRALF